MHFFTPSTSWPSVQMIIMGVAGGMLNLSHNNYVLQKRTIINSANSEFIEIERKHMGEFHHKEMGGISVKQGRTQREQTLCSI